MCLFSCNFFVKHSSFETKFIQDVPSEFSGSPSRGAVEHVDVFHIKGCRSKVGEVLIIYPCIDDVE